MVQVFTIIIHFHSSHRIHYNLSSIYQWNIPNKFPKNLMLGGPYLHPQVTLVSSLVLLQHWCCWPFFCKHSFLIFYILCFLICSEWSIHCLKWGMAVPYYCIAICVSLQFCQCLLHIFRYYDFECMYIYNCCVFLGNFTHYHYLMTLTLKILADVWTCIWLMSNM